MIQFPPSFFYVEGALNSQGDQAYVYSVAHNLAFDYEGVYLRFARLTIYCKAKPLAVTHGLPLKTRQFTTVAPMSHRRCNVNNKAAIGILDSPHAPGKHLAISLRVGGKMNSIPPKLIKKDIRRAGIMPFSRP